MPSFELEGLLSMDAGEFVAPAEDAADASEEFADSADAAEESLLDLDAAGIAAGGALAGAGTAMQGVLDDTQELNESLGRTGVNMDLTADETRDLATSMSDASFPLDDVVGSMDALAQIGVDTEEEMREVAEASDLLADATGSSAERIADELAPAVQALDGDLDALTDDADAFTSAVRDTGLEMSDLSSTIERLDFDELEELGLDAADTAQLIGEFGDQTGFSGRRLRREFRQAVEGAEGDLDELGDELGLSAEEMEELTAETDAGSEQTEAFAEAANDSLTATDSLRAGFDDLRLQASGLLGPVSAAAPAMQGLGVAAIGLSTINFGALIPSIAGVVTAMGPLLPVLLAVTAAGGALALLFGEEIREAFEDVTEFLFDDVIPPLVEFGEDVLEDVVMPAVEDAGEILKSVFGDMADAADDLIEAVGPPLEDLFDGIVDFVTDALGVIEDAWDDHASDIADEVDATIDAIEPPITSTLETVEDIVDSVLGEIEDFWDAHGDTIESIVDTLSEYVLGTLENLLDVAANVVQAGLNIIQGDWSGFRDNVEAIVDALFDQLRLMFETGFEILDDLTGGALSDIEEALTNLREFVEGAFETNISDAFASAFGAAADAISSALEGVIEAVTSVLDPVAEAIESTIGAVNDLRGVDISVDVPSPSDLIPDGVPIIGGGGGGSGGGDGGGGGSTPPPGGSPGRPSPVAHTGGMIGRTGTLIAEEGERMLPTSQVNDRGEADLAGGGADADEIGRAVDDALGDRLDQLIRSIQRLESADVAREDVLRALDVAQDRRVATRPFDPQS